MTRMEFLQQLRQALENDLSGSVVQENVDFYNQYIKNLAVAGDHSIGSQHKGVRHRSFSTFLFKNQTMRDQPQTDPFYFIRNAEDLIADFKK